MIAPVAFAGFVFVATFASPAATLTDNRNFSSGASVKRLYAKRRRYPSRHERRPHVPYCFGVCLFSVESGSENWGRMPWSGGIPERTGLRRKSLQNGNIRGQGQRLSAISVPRLEIENLETKSKAGKAGISGPMRRRLQAVANSRTAWLGREDSNLHIPN